MPARGWWKSCDSISENATVHNITVKAATTSEATVIFNENINELIHRSGSKFKTPIPTDFII